MSDESKYPRALYKGGKATYSHDSGKPEDDYVIVADADAEAAARKAGYMTAGEKPKAEK